MEALIEITNEPLTAMERFDLEQHEANIRLAEQRAFYEIGNELLAIRNDPRKLYREHGTFVEYCSNRLGYSHDKARLLMRASEVRDVLAETTTNVVVLPSTEAQTRPLLSLTPELQREAWHRAVETAPNGKLTGLHVASVVEEVKGGAMAVHYSSATPEWYTPSHIIDLVVEFFDEIDLDPCSNSHESPNVSAGMGYTEADDGLSKPWFGRVYMNPPYGDEIVGWVKKLHEEYQNGDIEAAIALLPARTDTRWWNDYVMPYAMCFIRGRLRFVGAENSAPFPSVLVYYGDEIERFTAATADLGRVMTVYGHTPGERLLEDFDE